MAIAQYVTVGPLTASSANNIVTSVTPTSGTALTLTAGALAGTIPQQVRRILLTFGNESVNRTLLVTGTNRYGNTISETLAVPSGAGSTVATLQDFKTVTSLLPGGGGAWDQAVTVGTNGVASSAWQTINKHIAPVNIEFWVITSGTVNYTVEYTPDDVNQGPFGNAPASPTIFSISALASKTSTLDGQLTYPAAYWRVTVNSNTNPAFVTAGALQAGIAGN